MQLELDVVVLVPVGEAPHREIEQRPGRARRGSTLCELAVAADERFGVVADRGRPGRGRRTRRTRSRRMREQRPDDELVLILGARPGGGARRLARARAGAGAGDRGRRSSAREWSAEAVLRADRRLAGGASGSSSSTCRGSTSRRRWCASRAAAGLPIRYLVPDEVANYVESAAPVRGVERRRRLVSPRALGDRRAIDSEALAERIAEIASDRKAIDIRVLDLRGHRRLHGLLRDLLRQHRAPDEGDPRRRLPGAEGRRGPAAAPRRGRARGALDPAGLPRRVVHIFTPDAREFYRLEKLWGDAPSPQRRLRLELPAWGCSSAGRASRWQREGQGFESPQLHFRLVTELRRQS